MFEAIWDLDTDTQRLKQHRSSAPSWAHDFKTHVLQLNTGVLEAPHRQTVAPESPSKVFTWYLRSQKFRSAGTNYVQTTSLTSVTRATAKSKHWPWILRQDILGGWGGDTAQMFENEAHREIFLHKKDAACEQSEILQRKELCPSAG
jgi:hypothetical protein